MNNNSNNNNQEPSPEEIKKIKQREASKKYYQANKDKVKSDCKVWQNANKDKVKENAKEWYLARREIKKQTSPKKIPFNRSEYQKNNRDAANKRSEKWRKNNLEKVKEVWKKSYLKHKEDILKKRAEYNKGYNQQHKERIAERQKEYQEKNKEKISLQREIWYEANKEKWLAYNKEYRKTYEKENADEIREKRRIRVKNKRKKDPIFRLLNNLRSRLIDAIRCQSAKKLAKTFELTGCTIQDLLQHLESQFAEGMTWENHGKFGWHIDHIIPCSSFDLSKLEEQQKCFHYNNLQPLWWKDNIAKSNKMPPKE